MLRFHLETIQRPLNILLLGAHCDDIEIGCGATVAQLVRRYPTARFNWVTLSSDAERAAETRAAAGRLLAGAGDVDIRTEEFRNSYFPHCQADLKDYFESLKKLEPELIFTHCHRDLHQDHRITHELTWNTFRDHAILEYEIPKFDGDLGIPSVFVPLSRDQMQHKCDVLMECFGSQLKRSWFTRNTFEALARLRGIECNAPDGYAEAFFCRKLRLAI